MAANATMAAAKNVITPPSSVLKRHEKMLDTIRHGTENEAIALFSEEGYDVNTAVDYTFDDRRTYVVTPLAWAVRYNRPLLSKYLLEKGADPYRNLVFDYYPLHDACNRGFDDIVKIFITHKCDVDRVTSDHHTPLHIACMRGNVECARLLLDAGANREVRNNCGQTPLELGIYHGQTDLYRLFSYYCDDSKPKIQRRHSLHSPTGEPRHPIKQIVSMDSTFSYRPQSMVLDYSDPSSEEPTLRTCGNINRARSRSNHHLPSLGFSFAAQPHTCSGSVAPTTSQLQVSPATMGSGGLSLSVTGRPTLIRQLSQASPCAADSPSPVEKDGVLPSSNSSKNKGVLNQKMGSVEVKYSSEAEPAKQFSCAEAVPKKMSSYSRRGSRDKQYLDTCSHSSVPLRNKPAPNHSHSNPEFPLLTHFAMNQPERTHSFDDLYSKHRQGPFHTQAEGDKISPSREKINHLSSQIYSSLDQNWAATAVSSYASNSYHHLLQDGCAGSESNPISEVMRKIIQVTSTMLHLDQAHIATLMSSSGITKEENQSFSSCSSAKTGHLYNSLISHLLGLGYTLVEKPLTVTFGVPAEDHMTLVFELVDQNEVKRDFLKVVARIYDLKNKHQSSNYHHSMDEMSLPSETAAEPLLEATLLAQLSQTPHPNVVKLVTTFRANTNEQHELFAQQMNPENPKKIYAVARIADFMVLRSPKVSLGAYLEAVKRKTKALKLSDVFPEVMVLSVLAQVLLAVSHLVRHQIAHCAVSMCNLFVDDSDSHHMIVLGNFSHAVQLNSLKQNLETVQCAQSQLSAVIGNNHRKGHCMVSPEVVEAVENSELEDAFLRSQLNNVFAKSDTFSAAWMIYTWFLGSSHDFIHRDQSKSFTYADIPSLSELSPRCNHLLKKLVAYNKEERLSPMEGAMACFVLIFGPNISNISTEEECYKWLLAEMVEFYLRPVLVDSKVRDYTDSFSKLLCMYLMVASSNPKAVWDACRFLSKCSV